MDTIPINISHVHIINQNIYQNEFKFFTFEV
jgi:hypothetical protein